MPAGSVRGAAPGPRPLLPGPMRAAGTGLLATCVTTVLAAFVAARGNPSRLDAALDPRIQDDLSRFPALLNWLPGVGTLKPVALMTLVLALACVATRRWPGAVLAVVAVPAATGLTEYVLKPSVGGILRQPFPSGHATRMFALAAVCAVLLAEPPLHRAPGALRLLLVLTALLLVLMALVLATGVAAAMIAIRSHTFTDAVGGAAVGTGVVLACALALDLVVSRARRAPAGPPGPAA